MSHVPVLLEEVIAGIAPVIGDVVVDGTFGAGGYTSAAVAAGAAHVFAFDRDPAAIANAKVDPAQVTLIHERFSLMDRALAARGVNTVDAIMLDIGVSSMQLDEAGRGFSFQSDGPLDMRMSSDGDSAADLCNQLSEAELADILYRYGEEPRSRRVAKAIVAARPLVRTGELADVVRKALGHRAGAPKDPATRTFQALRIAVNGELDELDAGLRAAERLLVPGGSNLPQTVELGRPETCPTNTAFDRAFRRRPPHTPHSALTMKPVSRARNPSLSVWR